MSNTSSGVHSGERGESGSSSKAESAESPTAVCAVCQQPVRRAASVRWRGKPIHEECVSGPPRRK